MSITPQRGRERVPVRTIAASIGLVLATVVALFLLVEVRRTLIWLVVAAFFAVALYPVVNWLESRVSWCRRSMATLAVYLLVFLVLGGLVAAFAVPLAHQSTTFADQLPGLINDAKAGRGPVGSLLQRTNALQYVEQNQDRIRADGLRSDDSGGGCPARCGHRHRRCRDDLRPLLPDGAGGAQDDRDHAEPPVAPAPRPGPPRRHRLREVRHRLHLGQPADQRHLRSAHLHRPEGHGRAVRRPDLAVRGHRRPHPAGGRHAGRRGGHDRRVHPLGARRHRPHRSSSWCTSSWRTTCCSR